MKPTTRNLLIGIASLGAAIYLGAESETAPEQDRDLTTKRVEVAAVEATDATRELRFSGVTRAERRARLAFPLGGRMIDRPIKVGDRVREGQILARLDPRELENAVATARGTLAELRARRGQAERDRDRTAQLVAAKAATSEELEQLGAGVEAIAAAETAAAARLREAERLLDEATLEAPFDGTVTEVLREPGEMALAGSPVVVLSGDGALELEVEVPESVVGHLRQGTDAKVVLPVLGRDAVAGRVVSVGRAAIGTGSLFPVRVALDNDGAGGSSPLVAGATAELVLELSSEGALAVPVEAVVNPGGQRPVVFRVVEDGEGTRAEKIAVEVSTLLGDTVVVHGPLAVGDLVVVGGQRGLLDGEAVEVLR